ncbi:MAG TPA: SBBP repeat-containing protein [Bryobacteraceae bacterium]|nr:SBBP repeat-containing protein [Bryobacteraceae bacterium]
MVIRRWVIGVFIGILFAASALSQQYTITTIAGTAGTTGFAGDGGSALGAQLKFPTGIAVDKSGNIYIADGLNNRVRKVSGGVITTVAGNGTAGYTGDKGQAASAELNNPIGLALDSSGNLYIADSANNVIRMVTSSGIITTFAGNNTAGYSGDKALATGAQLFNPVGVAADAAGNVYIADTGNNVIRQVYNGNIVTYAEGFTQPDAVAADSSGNIYVADTQGRRIVKYSNGVYTTIAGNGYGQFSGDNGPGPNAALYDPMGLAVDSSGNVYIADTFNCRIRKLTPAGIITTIAGNGALFFSGDGGPATQAALHFPHGVAVDSTGNVYIADTVNAVVRELQGTLPIVSTNGVVNAASFATQISPGALATVFGSNFALTNAGAQTPLPTSVQGVSVNVNGQLAPVLYVTSTQVNFQVPWETALGPATVSVAVNGGASNAVTVNVLGAAPGLFSSSSGQAIVQNSDYTLNGPSNPAKAGSTIMAYLSGSGTVSPAVADGAAAPSNTLVYLNSASSATIGSSTAQVSFAGLAPGFVGLVQMNIVVPSDLPTGNYPLIVTIGSETSNPATISVTQ